MHHDLTKSSDEQIRKGRKRAATRNFNTTEGTGENISIRGILKQRCNLTGKFNKHTRSFILSVRDLESLPENGAKNGC